MYLNFLSNHLFPSKGCDVTLSQTWPLIVEEKNCGFSLGPVQIHVQDRDQKETEEFSVHGVHTTCG